jgi:hypothetical protein
MQECAHGLAAEQFMDGMSAKPIDCDKLAEKIALRRTAWGSHFGRKELAAILRRELGQSE